LAREKLTGGSAGALAAVLAECSVAESADGSPAASAAVLAECSVAEFVGGWVGALRCLATSPLPVGVLDDGVVPASVPPVAWAIPDPVASAAPNPRVTAPAPSQP
jgi:hypothetical protein